MDVLLKGNSPGFTLMEMVLVMVLLGILSVAAFMMWPRGMKEEGDRFEVKHAMRFAQHLAMTRPYEPGNPWGFKVEPGGRTYSVLKKDGSQYALDPTTGNDMKEIPLNGGGQLVCDKDAIWFDRFGTPLDDTSLSPIASPFKCLVAGRTIKVYPETGYVE